MQRSAAVGALLLSLTASAHAADITCKIFESRIAQGLKHAVPTIPMFTVSEGKMTETTPHMAYTFSGADGISGNIECFDWDDKGEFDVIVDLKDVQPHESKLRVKKLQVVAAAAICALKSVSTAECNRTSSDLFAKIDRHLQIATAQKDPLPAADEFVEIADRTQIDLSAAPGTMQASIIIEAR